MSQKHSHACQGCGAQTSCEGELSRNYDGFPDVICATFHERGGTLNPDFICEACADKREAAERAVDAFRNGE